MFYASKYIILKIPDTYRMEMSGIVQTVRNGSKTDQENRGSSPPEVSSALKEAVRIKSSVTVVVREAEAFCLGLPDLPDNGTLSGLYTE